MKKRFTLILGFMVLAFMQNGLFAQDIIDIPPVDDENEPALAYTIIGDTLANGDRANPNRIYRLERGGIYVVTAFIIANYSLSIIAGGDEDLRPPMLVRGQFVDGTNLPYMIKLTGDETHHQFKDILFNAVDLNREYDAQWTQAVVSEGDGQSISFERCIFNAFTGGATAFTGADASIYIRDCTWRNGVWPSHMFVGQQVTMPALPVDTLIVTNNTYFNNNAFWLYQEDGFAKFAVIEHNTIFTSLVDMMRLRYSSNAYIRSNLFYGTHAYGDSEQAQEDGWYEPDASPMSIVSLYEVPSDLLEEAGMTEEGRVVHLTYNAFFKPQPIIGYWDAHAGISGPSFMNPRTQGLFDSHESFFEHDNVEKDPSFIDTDMDTWVTGKVADYCTTYRATLTGSNPLSGNAGDNRNYDELQGVDILSGIQWPLPENMEYDDAELLVGGHDGLPVGDLNWFEGKRAQYYEPTSVSTGLSTPLAAEYTGYNLKQNYPNPFNAETSISFTIPEKGLTTLHVYDMMGKEILTLVNEDLVKGTYTYEFDTVDLIPGNYFYKLTSGKYVGIKKMTVLK